MPLIQPQKSKGRKLSALWLIRQMVYDDEYIRSKIVLTLAVPQTLSKHNAMLSLERKALFGKTALWQSPSIVPRQWLV